MSEIYYLVSDRYDRAIPLTDNKGNPPWWNNPRDAWKRFLVDINYDVGTCVIMTVVPDHAVDVAEYDET